MSITLEQKKTLLNSFIKRKQRIIKVGEYNLDDSKLDKLDRLNDEFNHFVMSLKKQEKEQLINLINTY